jgi:secondary thiamine-phosphate synthase enzyme
MWSQSIITVNGAGRGFREVTGQLQQAVHEAGLRIGLCHLFLRHTSASLCIVENADPDVRADLEAFMQRLAPPGDPQFRHQAEGPDDMPGHLGNLLAGCELSVPIRDGRLALGTWQGIFVWEHRGGRHPRELVVTLNGER